MGPSDERRRVRRVVSPGGSLPDRVLDKAPSEAPPVTSPDMDTVRRTGPLVVPRNAPEPDPFTLLTMGVLQHRMSEPFGTTQGRLHGLDMTGWRGRVYEL